MAGSFQGLSQGTNLQQKQEQTLSAHQLQSLHILEAPLTELQEIINTELEINPVLEIKDPEYEEAPPEETHPAATDDDPDDFDASMERILESTAAGDSPEDLSLPYDPTEAEETEERRTRMFELLTDRESMQESLMKQLRLTAPDEQKARICEAIIGGIDETGYLKTHPADIAMAEQCSMEEVESALKLVQSFEPAGIGARDLKECLCLQIPPNDPDAEDLKTLIQNHLDDLAEKRFSVICQAMDLPSDAVRKLAGKLRSLNPTPGGAIAHADPVYVIPEVEIVPDEKSGFLAKPLRTILPELQLSNHYLSMLENPETTKEVREYLKEKILRGNNLINALEQRENTVLRVAKNIAEEQFDFLRDGIDALRPMTMKHIADKLGVDESTVSRAVSGRYIKTPQGIFELKYFFTGGFRADDGTEFSTRSVKEQLKTLIDDEDPRFPLSDSKLAELLKEKGLDISRRTVAKYREELGIEASHLRKALRT